MDLDELLALMAAPIYAARLHVAVTSGEFPMPPGEWQARRNEAMQASVTEARMIWEIAEAMARSHRVRDG